MELSVADRDWLLKRVREQRDAEAKAIEKAAKGK